MVVSMITTKVIENIFMNCIEDEGDLETMLINTAGMTWPEAVEEYRSEFDDDASEKAIVVTIIMESLFSGIEVQTR